MVIVLLENMRKITTLLLFYLVSFLNVSAQTKNFIDQPYIETSVVADTLIVPNRIFLAIHISELDSKGKISTENMEQVLVKKLTDLDIDTEKDLTLLTLSSDFKKYVLKKTNIVKSKTYQLVVRNAILAGEVLVELEKSGIANVEITEVAHSNAKQIQLALKIKAISTAKNQAKQMTAAINQTIGPAIFISDGELEKVQPNSEIKIRGAASIYGSRTPELYKITFDKIEYQVKVKVIFTLK